MNGSCGPIIFDSWICKTFKKNPDCPELGTCNVIINTVRVSTCSKILMLPDIKFSKEVKLILYGVDPLEESPFIVPRNPGT